MCSHQVVPEDIELEVLAVRGSRRSRPNARQSAGSGNQLRVSPVNLEGGDVCVSMSKGVCTSN